MIHYNYWCILRIHKVIQHFRFGRDFPNGAVLGDFEPLRNPKGTFLRQTTSFEPSYVKIRCELWSVGELTKQKEEEEKNREYGTVYFTHMGSRFR